MSAQERHLRVVRADPPAAEQPRVEDLSVEQLQEQVRELGYRIGLAKGLLSHRDWTGCEHNVRLVTKALDGASIAELGEEDRK